jgi:hypothetical protein
MKDIGAGHGPSDEGPVEEVECVFIAGTRGGANPLFAAKVVASRLLAQGLVRLPDACRFDGFPCVKIDEGPCRRARGACDDDI